MTMIKHKFSRPFVLQALEGNNRALNSAFAWYESPQGFDYWSRIAHSLNNSIPLDAEAYLKWLIREDIKEDLTDYDGE